MNKRVLIAFMILMLALIVGCGPAIIVENKTGFVVRVVVTSSDGTEAVSPSPGESSAVEVSEGAYTASAIPDAEWVEYAKITRKLLNDQLANSQNLSGEQLLDVIRRLKDIAAKMQAFEQAAGGGASCRGSVSSESGGTVIVSQGADGKLAITCR